jgi:hypothetical protein
LAFADSTHTSARRRARALPVALACLAALVAGAVWAAPAAFADGDPASDVLASQSLFLPGDGGITPAEQSRLTELMRSAQRSGYPIRVALIATPADLGSVSELWQMPATYARFLGQELSLVFRGPLLVVMPDGYGLDAVGTAPAAGRPTLPRLPQPGSGRSLGAAAATAITRLAAAAGHHLPLTPATPAGATGSALGSVDLGSWVALVAGAGLIALAWTASLRARPARRRRAA